MMGHRLSSNCWACLIGRGKSRRLNMTNYCLENMWQCQRKGPTLSILENEIRAFEVKKVKFIENEILLKMASIVSQLS